MSESEEAEVQPLIPLEKWLAAMVIEGELVNEIEK